MTRKMLAFAIGMLLLCAGFCAACAEEEGKTPATPTDLSCLHEHTKTTIYFYDSPAYSALNANSHRVSGPAAVETVCEDCGAQLSYETVSYVEEVRPHTMKKGVCVLCGYRTAAKAKEDFFEDAPGERTVYAQEDAEAAGLLTLTLTTEELAKLEQDDVVTLLVRGETGEDAVALAVTEVRVQTEQAEEDLYVQFAEQEDGSFFAGVFLGKAEEKRKVPEEGISLRFYRDKRAEVRVAMAPAATEELAEAEGEWNDRGFWTVNYTEEGTYFLLQ